MLVGKEGDQPACRVWKIYCCGTYVEQRETPSDVVYYNSEGWLRGGLRDARIHRVCLDRSGNRFKLVPLDFH